MRIVLHNHTERGYAVVMMIALISLLVVVMMANTQNIRHLGRELNRLEDRQNQHWQNFKVSTNLMADAFK